LHENKKLQKLLWNFHHNSLPASTKFLKGSIVGEASPFPKRNSWYDVLVDNDKELRICFLLIVNEELIMEIARLGKDVKVISPLHLEKEVKKYLKKALDRYTNNT
jgi:predicted DNA-binding transcriptional regulator YafY